MLQHNDGLDLPTIQSDRFEELAPGCTFEWIYGGQIRFTTLQSTDRDTIDAWCDRWIQIREQWTPQDPPIYILSRITTAIEALTPYARQRSVDIGLIRPEIPTYCAVVLPQSLIGQIVKLYIWSISTFSPKLKVQIFFDFEAGLQWLAAHVEHHNQTPPPTPAPNHI